MIPSSPFLPPIQAYVQPEASFHEAPVIDESATGESAIDESAIDGLDYILTRYGASHINDMHRGISVLGQAIQAGDEQAIALLLKAGARSLVSNNCTALVMAAS